MFVAEIYLDLLLFGNLRGRNEGEDDRRKGRGAPHMVVDLTFLRAFPTKQNLKIIVCPPLCHFQHEITSIKEFKST